MTTIDELTQDIDRAYPGNPPRWKKLALLCVQLDRSSLELFGREVLLLQHRTNPNESLIALQPKAAYHFRGTPELSQEFQSILRWYADNSSVDNLLADWSDVSLLLKS